MVSGGKASLDHAYNWNWDFRLRAYDVFVSFCFHQRLPLNLTQLNIYSLPIQLYLVDSFTYAASALSAASVLRSLLGFAFPLFGSQMYAALGIGGGNSLLAGLAIVIGIPFPIWIWFKGEAIRAKSSLAR